MVCLVKMSVASTHEHSIDRRPPREPLVVPGEMDLHVRDMTATFAADVTLQAAQDALAAHHQWLPIDGFADRPLGELVEKNSTGPLRLGYGAWRDLLLGVQFRNGRGELISAGGRTVKNVAGYDLTKLMVGQRGVFGKILTLTVRTYLRPHGALRVRQPPDVSVVSRVIPTALRPQWAVLRRDELVLGYFGDDTALAWYAQAIGEAGASEIIRRPIEHDIAERESLWNFQGEITFRASVPPAELGRFVASLPTPQWTCDAAFGIVVGSVANMELPSLRASVEKFKGTLVIDGVASNGFEFTTSPEQRRLIERLKHAFDPDGLLNPLPWQAST